MSNYLVLLTAMWVAWLLILSAGGLLVDDNPKVDKYIKRIRGCIYWH